MVEVVCTDAGQPAPDRLSWRRRTGDHSTGLTRREAGLIAVRAGTDEVDQRLTLLHELAHWLTPARRLRRRSIHHGREFYTIAFDLYARHGLAPTIALSREAARYPSSLRHAVALGVPGAAAALAARRAASGARLRRRWRVSFAEHEIQLTRAGRWTVCAVCGHRIVGPYLAWLRRRRHPARHVLWSRA